MIELISLLALAAVAIGVVLVAGFVLKLAFKVLLFPVWLAIGLVKVVGGLVVGLVVAVLCLVLAPLAILALIVALPLLALLALVGLGGAVFAA